MGARSGNNYLSALRRLKAALWVDEVRVEDPTVHPLLKPWVRAIASLYDFQIEHPGAMTYRLDDGDRIGYSFVRPASIQERNKRSEMLQRWAELSIAVLPETPDPMNLQLTAMAAAAEFFAASDRAYGEHLQNYYHEARRRDWCIAGTAPGGNDGDLRLVSRNDAGIVVSGSRRLSPLGPLAEELLIFPSAITSAEQALCFAIGANTRGIELRCRTSPNVPSALSECVATFDQVAVPANRIFLCGDVERCNAMLERTGAATILAEQRAVRAAVAAKHPG